MITDSLSNRIASVVDEAVDFGTSPREFIQCVRECWSLRLQERLSFDDKTFEEALKRK